MDESSRGHNLGSKGPLLDSSDEGLSWSTAGPLGASSPLNYASLDGTQKAKIINKHNGNYFVDFTKLFTIGIWVKTVDQGNFIPVFEGWSTSASTYAFYLFFYLSRNEDQITVHLINKERRSSINGKSRLSWRHVAVTYRGGSNMSYFLNGADWPILQTITISKPLFADIINIGHRSRFVF